MKRVRSIFAILTIAALMFTSIPVMTGNFNVHAASVKKPVKVTGLKKYAVGTNYIHFQWNKIKKNKNTKGYAIYLNGKLYKRVGVKTYRYKIPKLKSNTAYKVSIRAYNTYKQKQYYNSKTKKWQTKKPAKKNWKGKKTRKVTAYAYGSASATLTIKTTKPATQQETVSSPTTPAHQHSYNIPIYGEVEDLEQCTVWHCNYCNQTYVATERMSSDEQQAISDAQTEHAFAERNAWYEANYDRLISDDVYERIAAQQEYANIPTHTGYYTTEFISHGWIDHQIIGWKCSCGSKRYDVTGWRNEEMN